MSEQDLEKLCVNTIRAVSADQPQIASSGHPGAPMGCAPMAHVLWGEIMKYSSKDSQWIDRDRFVLNDLKKFRQLGSKTPGHPECFMTEGVEVCTGPLGQGLSNAVGMAIAERQLATTYNEGAEYPVFDHHTYVICGDGCMQEGVTSESCSLAGHLGLGRLIVLYDDNNITIDGSTDLSFTEDVLKRFEAYGWHTRTVSDITGSLDDLRNAIKEAKEVTDKPSIIKIKTAIGYGSPSKQGSEAAHGAPLGKEDLEGAKKFYGLPSDKTFYIPDEVQDYYKKVAKAGDEKRTAWEAMFAKYTEKFPEKAAEISRRFANEIPKGLIDKLPKFEYGKDKDMATRKYSGKCIATIGPNMPEFVGGSADLSPSNNTTYSGVVDFQKDSYDGRYFRFGVREHGMVSICNGMFAHGGMRPYCASFLAFVSYCVGAIRVAALSRFGVIFVMTHDSIGLGEDGPTHQPIEIIESLRALPNLLVYRPADSNETTAAYKTALERTSTPTVICLTRQNVPSLKNSSMEKACKGAYICVEESKSPPALVLVATGSEVGPCMEAAEALEKDGIATRVVSMPCQEVFLEQDKDYQKSVLPGNVPTLSVEASAIHGWHQFSHAQIGMTTYGASGKATDLFKHFGFTKDNITNKGKKLVEFFTEAKQPVPDLSLRPVFNNIMNGGGH